MSGFTSSLLGFVVAIAILVTVHEYGHFQVARRLGVKVLKFSIGFGPALFKWRRRDDPTEYCIGLIPLGGYVKMLDEREGEVEAEEREMAFNRKSLAARSAIVVAGPAYNFLFAIFAVWLMFVVGSDDIEPVVGAVAESSVAQIAGFRVGDRIVGVDGREVSTWSQHQIYLLHQAMRGKVIDFEVVGSDDSGGSGSRRNIPIDFGAVEQYAIGGAPVTAHIGLRPTAPAATVFRLVENSPAAEAGLQRGDAIIAIDGEPVRDWFHLVQRVSSRPGQKLSLSVRRGDLEIETELTTEAVVVDGERYGRMGLYRPPLENARLRYGPLAAIPASLDYNWRTTVVTLRSLGRMLSARMSSENLAGPITIARLAGQMVESGYDDFLRFLAIISISLGLINLLPIPLLDGGHLLYFAIEAVRGRPLSERSMLRGQQIGIVLLALLMSVAFYNDIMRLF